MLDIQTETDVASILNSYAARQPDNDHFRLWEVAGTAHADAHLVGADREVHRLRRADQQRPDAHRRQGRAARAHDLARRPARLPSMAPRIDVTPGAAPQVRRNADGDRARRHPHPAGRRARRGAVGRAGPEPVDDLPAARFDEAVPRGPARAALSVTRHVPPALRPDADDDQGRLRAPRRSRGAVRVRRTVADRQVERHHPARRASMLEPVGKWTRISPD